ncbi:hypothetical protein FBU59_005973 [Linderina macrospora]|uniref:Uncharacterized protein n=1 Tax=Linderina macrospora TaxID=4868 RepID=A0ACC1J193_9FUNG|nr:hypothetical protein FBU59_005973 [Linderina macrospora]
MGYPQEQYKQLDANVHYVRRVAPNKDMYCLSVRLPKSVAYAADNEGEESTAVSAKRKPEDATDLEENDAKCPKAE